MPTTLVTGANRGLGLELVRQYAADGWRVLACARDLDRAVDLRALESERVSLHALDVADPAQIGALAESLAGTAIDVLINNAGVFGPKLLTERDRRQSLGHLDAGVWDEVMRVNAFAPVKMAEAFVTHVAASGQRKIVAVSSTLGSTSDARSGNYAYRMSKAALNVGYVNLARELASRGILVRLLCPGWVRTSMGGPNAAVSPEESVRGMRARIAELDAASSGIFVRFNGEPIPW
jgi:NAD(P)-dependent dehydrogenase (short-subunit alcohol dehydrogenase family)